MVSPMQAFKIIVVCVLLSMLYGIVHDQITARVCVEYFTIGHPPVFGDLDDPALLGLGWGVVATWWVGLILGILLALAARAGSNPKRELSDLIGPILRLLMIMGCAAFIAGCVGWLMARNGWVVLVPPMRDLIPLGKHEAFLADLWAHSASYGVGFVGGIVVICRVRKSRTRENEQTSPGMSSNE